MDNNPYLIEELPEDLEQDMNRVLESHLESTDTATQQTEDYQAHKNTTSPEKSENQDLQSNNTDTEAAKQRYSTSKTSIETSSLLENIEVKVIEKSESAENNCIDDSLILNNNDSEDSEKELPISTEFTFEQNTEQINKILEKMDSFEDFKTEFTAENAQYSPRREDSTLAKIDQITHNIPNLVEIDDDDMCNTKESEEDFIDVDQMNPEQILDNFAVSEEEKQQHQQQEEDEKENENQKFEGLSEAEENLIKDDLFSATQVSLGPSEKEDPSSYEVIDETDRQLSQELEDFLRQNSDQISEKLLDSIMELPSEDERDNEEESGTERVEKMLPNPPLPEEKEKVEEGDEEQIEKLVPVLQEIEEEEPVLQMVQEIEVVDRQDNEVETFEQVNVSKDPIPEKNEAEEEKIDEIEEQPNQETEPTPDPDQQLRDNFSKLIDVLNKDKKFPKDSDEESVESAKKSYKTTSTSEMSSTGESGSDTSEESEYQVGESICTQFEKVPQVEAQLVEIDENEEEDEIEKVAVKPEVQELLNNQQQSELEEEKEEKKEITEDSKSFASRDAKLHDDFADEINEKTSELHSSTNSEDEDNAVFEDLPAKPVLVNEIYSNSDNNNETFNFFGSNTLNKILGWSDPKISATYFITISAILLTFMTYPILYLLNRACFYSMILVFLAKSYYQVLFLLNKGDKDPFADYVCDKKKWLDEKKVEKFLEKTLAFLKSTALSINKRIINSDIKKSLKFLFNVYLLTLFSNIFPSVLSLLLFINIGFFSVPKLYVNNKKVVDQNLEKALAVYNEKLEMVLEIFKQKSQLVITKVNGFLPNKWKLKIE